METRYPKFSATRGHEEEEEEEEGEEEEDNPRSEHFDFWLGDCGSIGRFWTF